MVGQRLTSLVSGTSKAFKCARAPETQAVMPLSVF